MNKWVIALFFSVSVGLVAVNLDYYDVLGVPRTASQAEITTAYRKLEAQYHPDKNPGNQKKVAEAKMQEANKAYATLSHSEQRARYDAANSPTLKPTGAAAGSVAAPAVVPGSSTTISPTNYAAIASGVGNLIFQGTLAWAQVLAARNDAEVKRKLEVLKDTAKPAQDRANAAAYIEARFIAALQALIPVLDQVVTLAIMADAVKGQKLKDEVDTYKGYLHYMSLGNESIREFLAQAALSAPSTAGTPFVPEF